jgi:hypothetical protein
MSQLQRNQLSTTELVTVYAARDLRDPAGVGHNIGHAHKTRFDNAKLLVRSGDYQWEPPEVSTKSVHREADGAARSEYQLSDLGFPKKLAKTLEGAGLVNKRLLLSRTAADVARQSGIGVDVAEAVLQKALETWGPLKPEDDLDMTPAGGEDE